MLEGPFVFVDIDTQRDFLEPTGALYVPNSAEILPNLERLTRFARVHRIPVLATSCAHYPGDPELNRFPPHCMAGTEGEERIAETTWPDSTVLDVDERLGGEIPPHLTLLKPPSWTYSADWTPANWLRDTIARARPSSSTAWRPITAWQRPWKDC